MMRNVQGNVAKSRKFGFFVQEFRLHWLATMHLHPVNLIADIITRWLKIGMM